MQQQNQWLAERLNEEHQRDLMAQAEKARQAQLARLASKSQSLLQKLRADLMNLTNKSQDDTNSNR